MADFDLLGLHVNIDHRGRRGGVGPDPDVGSAAKGEGAEGVGALEAAFGKLKDTLLGVAATWVSFEGIVKVAELTAEGETATVQLSVAFKNAGLEMEKYGGALNALTDPVPEVRLRGERDQTPRSPAGCCSRRTPASRTRRCRSPPISRRPGSTRWDQAMSDARGPRLQRTLENAAPAGRPPRRGARRSNSKRVAPERQGGSASTMATRRSAGRSIDDRRAQEYRRARSGPADLQ